MDTSLSTSIAACTGAKTAMTPPIATPAVNAISIIVSQLVY